MFCGMEKVPVDTAPVFPLIFKQMQIHRHYAHHHHHEYHMSADCYGLK